MRGDCCAASGENTFMYTRMLHTYDREREREKERHTHTHTYTHTHRIAARVSVDQPERPRFRV
jgi:hypothetical protein